MLERIRIKKNDSIKFNINDLGPVVVEPASTYRVNWLPGYQNENIEDYMFKNIKPDRVHFSTVIFDGNPGDGKSTLAEDLINVAYDRYGRNNVNMSKLKQAYHCFFCFDDKPIQILLVDDAMTKKIHQKYIAYMMELRHAYKKDEEKWDILDHDPNTSCNIIFIWLLQDMFELHKSIRKIGNFYFFKSYPGNKQHRIDLANDFITHEGLGYLKTVSAEINLYDIDESKSKSFWSSNTHAGMYESRFVHEDKFHKYANIDDTQDEIGLKLVSGEQVIKI